MFADTIYSEYQSRNNCLFVISDEVEIYSSVFPHTVSHHNLVSCGCCVTTKLGRMNQCAFTAA